MAYLYEIFNSIFLCNFCFLIKNYNSLARIGRRKRIEFFIERIEIFNRDNSVVFKRLVENYFNIALIKRFGAVVRVEKIDIFIINTRKQNIVPLIIKRRTTTTPPRLSASLILLAEPR